LAKKFITGISIFGIHGFYKNRSHCYYIAGGLFEKRKKNLFFFRDEILEDAIEGH